MKTAQARQMSAARHGDKLLNFNQERSSNKNARQPRQHNHLHVNEYDMCMNCVGQRQPWYRADAPVHIVSCSIVGGQSARFVLDHDHVHIQRESPRLALRLAVGPSHRLCPGPPPRAACQRASRRRLQGRVVPPPKHVFTFGRLFTY